MTKATYAKNSSVSKLSAKSVIAKSEDGTIQITFTIPYSVVKQKRDEVLKELTKDISVPGFRKGKAPRQKAEAKIPKDTVIETLLQKLLPKLLADAINEHKIKPATYPKFELIKAKEGEDWQIRATTCELPGINLGDYKKTIIGASRTKSIWTPNKGNVDEKKKEPSQEEKEQEIIKILIESVDVKVPKVLIDEEVNNRLSSLLERIEKLGLTLEGYLASVGKSSESLRQEYEKQAKDAISLTLILNKVAVEEKVNISEDEIDKVLRTSAKDEKDFEKLNTPEQRRLIEATLTRRWALDSLASLL